MYNSFKLFILFILIKSQSRRALLGSSYAPQVVENPWFREYVIGKISIKEVVTTQGGLNLSNIEEIYKWYTTLLDFIL